MAEKKETTGTEALLILAGLPVAIVGVTIAFIPLTLYCAWCDMHIWNWFAAPYLHLVPMSLWVSFGIGYWVRLQVTSTKVVDGEKTKFWMGIATSILTHSFSLMIAFLVHKYITK